MLWLPVEEEKLLNSLGEVGGLSDHFSEFDFPDSPVYDRQVRHIFIWELQFLKFVLRLKFG